MLAFGAASVVARRVSVCTGGRKKRFPLREGKKIIYFSRYKQLAIIYNILFVATK